MAQAQHRRHRPLPPRQERARGGDRAAGHHELLAAAAVFPAGGAEVRAERDRPRAAAQAQGHRHGGGAAGLVAQERQEPGGRAGAQGLQRARHDVPLPGHEPAAGALQQREGPPGDQLRHSDPGPHAERALRLCDPDEEPAAAPDAGLHWQPLALQARHREGAAAHEGGGRQDADPREARRAGRLRHPRAGRGVAPARAGEDRLQGGDRQGDGRHLSPGGHQG